MQRLLTIILLLLAGIMLALPAAIGALGAKPAAPPEPDGADSIPVKVFFPESGKVEAIPLGAYLKSVVAGEMPPEFEMEALKAQFVVARTYTVRRMKEFGGKGGCPLHPEADVCADFSTSQAFQTLEGLIRKHGKLTARSFWRRLGEAQAETAGQVLTYKGELIDALYHAVSGRLTENAADYFTDAVPYLVAVDDRWGAHSPKLITQKRFEPGEFARALAAGGKSPVLAVTAAARAGRSPVQVVERTATGRVKSVRVGELTLTGRQFRERLGLRSTDFRVFLEGGQLVVETVGDGHGVGMSQYGADGMAQAGHTYRQILSHYYKGATVSRLFDG
ncbi:MAG: stage II sporulation protein D [Bacillota bacterium]